ncbi:MAG: hypothetical protein OEV87_12695 [Phycisphaerae bacterium]|nr:hypothetical protein [Phycisphaerae bacterium]
MGKKTENQPEASETRESRFKRIAAKRTNDIIHKLRLLGNCSNRSSYDYDEQQISKIFSTIERELKEAKARFTYGRNKKEFKL